MDRKQLPVSKGQGHHKVIQNTVQSITVSGLDRNDFTGTDQITDK